MKTMLLVTADYASIDRATGKLNILGAFSRINAKKFPTAHPRMAIALRLRAALGDHHDERILRIEMVDEDGNRLLKFSGPFRFKRTQSGEPREFNAVLELNGVEFPKPGFYEFVVFVDDVDVGRTTVALVQVPQQPE